MIDRDAVLRRELEGAISLVVLVEVLRHGAVVVAPDDTHSGAPLAVSP